MSGSDDADYSIRIVIWEKGAVICTAVNCPPNDLEIAIAVDGFVVNRQRFSDNDAAGAFAIEQMRARYDAG